MTGATRNTPGARNLPDRANNLWSSIKRGLLDYDVCGSLGVVNPDLAALPNDIDALKAALLAARAEAAAAVAQCSSDQALIAHLKLEIAKLNRDRFGPRSERDARLLNQMELQLEELEATATEDELAAEDAAARPARYRRSPASGRRAGHSPHICRASVW